MDPIQNWMNVTKYHQPHHSTKLFQQNNAIHKQVKYNIKNEICFTYA